MNRVYIQLEEDELTLRWKVVFRDARNNEVIGVPARNLSIDEAGSLIDPLSFAFEYGTRYASEVIRRETGITDVSHRAAGALDDDADAEPEVVMYQRLHEDHRRVGGGRFVIESKDRVALRSGYGSEMWHLYTKKRKARSAPLSDWHRDDLAPARKGTTSEAQATKWVVDGEWGEP
jgi:hypothetical protein